MEKKRTRNKKLNCWLTEAEHRFIKDKASKTELPLADLLIKAVEAYQA